MIPYDKEYSGQDNIVVKAKDLRRGELRHFQVSQLQAEITQEYEYTHESHGV